MFNSFCYHLIAVLVFFYVLQVFISLAVDNKFALLKNKNDRVLEYFTQQKDSGKSKENKKSKKIKTKKTQKNKKTKKVSLEEQIINKLKVIKGREEKNKIFPQIVTKDMTTGWDNPNMVKK